MQYQVLARKWRPKKFLDVIGQDHIVKTLKNSIQNDRVGHAYLFTGTRGIGKTTIARIFAKALRCENLVDADPCLECESCKSIEDSSSLDYIEVDGASNNGVENIRDIIEKVQYLPTRGKYRIFVIDEVHMLSTGAFNALLKTLEEPPEHVIFIFATTDPQRLLGTVLSRCQRFDFKNANVQLIFNHLKKITNKENIEVDSDDALQEIAYHANGSVRDALSLMDQVLSLTIGEKVSLNSVYDSLGLVKKNKIEAIVASLVSKDEINLIDNLNEVLSEDIEIENVCSQILDEFESILGLSTNLRSRLNISDFNKFEALWLYESLLKDFTWSLKSFSPLKATKVVLLKSVNRENIIGTKPVSEIKKKSNLQINSPKPAPQPNNIESKDATEVKTKEPKTWEFFISFVAKKNRALGINLERASVKNNNLNGQPLTLFYSSSNKIFYDFIKEPQNLGKLQEHLIEYTDKGDFSVNVELIDDQTKEREKLENVVEKKENIEKKIREDKIESVKNDKYIMQAKDLFGADINKITLDEDS